MKLGRLATERVVTIENSDSLDKAISLMDEHHIHHLPVLDGTRVAGMISDRDLLISVGWRLARDRSLGEDDTVAGPTTARQVMHAPVVTLSPEDTVHDAARVMVEKNISAVVLTGAGGGILGIVTKLDLLQRIAELARSDSSLAVLKQPVERHMRANVVTARPKTTIQEAVALMHDRYIRHLPVVAGETVLGIVTDRDARRACGVEMIEDEQAEESGEMYVGPASVLEIMSHDLQTATRDMSLLAACEQMVTCRIGCLPVVNNDQLVGIITDTDVLRFLSHAEV